MKFYFKEYSKDEFNGKGAVAWEYFGKIQLNKLLDFLGAKNDTKLREVLVGAFSYGEAQKGNLLIEANTIDTNIYFLISGTVKIYKLNEGNKMIGSAIGKGGLVASSRCFVEGKESDVFMECNENCRYLVSSKEILDETMAHFPEAYNDLLSSIINHALDFQKKLSSLLLLPNEQKLKILYTELSDIFNLLTLKDIASISGMKPETISRMRNKISRQKEIT